MTGLGAYALPCKEQRILNTWWSHNLNKVTGVILQGRKLEWVSEGLLKQRNNFSNLPSSWNNTRNDHYSKVHWITFHWGWLAAKNHTETLLRVGELANPAIRTTTNRKLFKMAQSLEMAAPAISGNTSLRRTTVFLHLSPSWVQFIFFPESTIKDRERTRNSHCANTIKY